MYFRVMAQIDEDGREELWVCDKCIETYNDLITTKEWVLGEETEETMNCDMCDKEVI